MEEGNLGVVYDERVKKGCREVVVVVVMCVCSSIFVRTKCI